MVSVLKLVTHLVTGDKFGVKAKDLTEESRKKLVEVATFISVDNTKAFVTMGELRQTKKCRKWSLQNSARSTLRQW